MTPPIQHLDLRKYANARVSGVLTDDAHMAPTMGAQPHMLLVLDFAPAQGLPYHARIDLGTDATEHMAAEAELPRLRRGALVSVGGDSLQLCRDHGHELLRVVGARALVVFSDPIKERTP